MSLDTAAGHASKLLGLLMVFLSSSAHAQSSDTLLVKDRTRAALLESSASSECVQTTFNITAWDTVQKVLPTGTVTKRNVVYIFYQTLDMCAREATTYGAELDDFTGLVLRAENDYATLDVDQLAEVRRCHIEGSREVCEQVNVPVSIHLRWTPSGEFYDVHGTSRMRMGANYSTYRTDQKVKLANITLSLSVDGEVEPLDVLRAHLGQVRTATFSLTPAP